MQQKDEKNVIFEKGYLHPIKIDYQSNGLKTNVIPGDCLGQHIVKTFHHSIVLYPTVKQHFN